VVFYPPELPDFQMLEFYAQHFKTVEINATYYQILPQSSFRRMAESTPPEFEFIVKTHRETTHVRRESQSAMKQLQEALKPLQEAGKFRGLLAQFPYSFKNSEAGRRHLLETKKLCGDIPLFAEFRHSSWAKPQVESFLRDHGIGYVNVDEPCLPNLLPPQDITTADTGYIRFHGRNEKNWWDGQGSARYNYKYSEDELREWLTNISHVLRKTYKTYIFFNNHPNGQAVKNAQQMLEILQKELLLE